MGRGQGERGPADDGRTCAVSRRDLDRQRARDPVAPAGPDPGRSRLQVGSGQVAQDLAVDQRPARVPDAPPAVLAPLPPGPAEGAIVQQVQRGVGVARRLGPGQVEAQLADP